MTVEARTSSEEAGRAMEESRLVQEINQLNEKIGVFCDRRDLLVGKLRTLGTKLDAKVEGDTEP
jgi:hypothetical protein